MRMQLLATGALGALALAGSATAATPAACDRACLQGMVDKYLAAVVAHDAHRLPLAKDVRYTENGQTLALNDGFWGTATAAGTYKHYFLDTRAQQAGFYGVMKENGQNNVILALRLKLRRRQISEIETVLGRSGLGTAGPNGAANLEAMGKPDDVWLADNPDHAKREDVIRVANMYFSALQNDDGKGDYSFFADDCYRLENGMQTTAGRGAEDEPQSVLAVLQRRLPDRLAAGGHPHPRPPLPRRGRREGCGLLLRLLRPQRPGPRLHLGRRDKDARRPAGPLYLGNRRGLPHRKREDQGRRGGAE